MEKPIHVLVPLIHAPPCSARSAHASLSPSRPRHPRRVFSLHFCAAKYHEVVYRRRERIALCDLTCAPPIPPLLNLTLLGFYNETTERRRVNRSVSHGSHHFRLHDSPWPAVLNGHGKVTRERSRSQAHRLELAPPARASSRSTKRTSLRRGFGFHSTLLACVEFFRNLTPRPPQPRSRVSSRDPISSFFRRRRRL